MGSFTSTTTPPSPIERLTRPSESLRKMAGQVARPPYAKSPDHWACADLWLVEAAGCAGGTLVKGIPKNCQKNHSWKKKTQRGLVYRTFTWDSRRVHGLYKARDSDHLNGASKEKAKKKKFRITKDVVIEKLNLHLQLKLEKRLNRNLKLSDLKVKP